jgi:hypothetical protein
MANLSVQSDTRVRVLCRTPADLAPRFTETRPSSKEVSLIAVGGRGSTPEVVASTFAELPPPDYFLG